jgi:hypothetical protein
VNSSRHGFLFSILLQRQITESSIAMKDAGKRIALAGKIGKGPGYDESKDRH